MQPQSPIPKTHLQQLQLLWDYLCLDTPLPKSADAVLVGGCNDLAVADRAASVFFSVSVPTIVMSGYHNPHSSLPVSEADYFGDRAASLGVPPTAIIRERKARNTGQNIIHGAQLLPGARSAILIHKPYMTRRFLATALKQWPEPQPRFFVTSKETSLEVYLARRGTEEIGTILGDFSRMHDYVAQGYQVYQDIPASAQQAYDKLRAAGYRMRGT